MKLKLKLLPLSAVLCAALCLAGVPCAAQAQLHVDTVSMKASGQGMNTGPYRLPYVTGTANSGDADAVQRINDWLFVAEVEAPPATDPRNPAKPIWPPSGIPDGVASLEYKVAANVPGWWSVTIFGEYMGAYPSAGEHTYNFDAHSGQILTVGVLFSPQGLATLTRNVHRARLKRLDDFVAKLPPEKPRAADASPSTGDDEDAPTAQRMIYGDCRPLIADGRLAEDELKLTPDRLVVVREHCAAHVVQAFDDLGEFSNGFAYAELAPLLSGYGRCLLVQRRTDCATDARGRGIGVYRGTLGGRYPVTFVIDAESGRVNYYFYDRVGKLIALEPKALPQRGLRFTESPENGPKAVFDLMPRPDGHLVGTWTQEGTGKTLAVDLH